MPYIGKSTTIGVRQRYMYTATASQTTFSGTDTQNLTLTYTDSNFVDVYLNGVLLKTGTDYTATSGTSVVLASGAVADDIVEIIVYDTFAVANFYNRTDSDSRYVNIDGDTMTGSLDLNGTELVLDVDGDSSITADTDDQIDVKLGGSDRISIKASGSTSVDLNAGGSMKLTVGDSDSHQFVNGSDTVLTIDSSGNVDLAGYINFSGTASSFASISQPRIFRSGSSSGSYPFDAFGHLVLQSRGDGSNRDIVFATGTGGANKSVIDDAGNFGIGDISPTKPLTLGTTTPVMLFDDQSSRTMEIRGPSTTHSATILTTYAADLLFGTNSTERMRILSGGNVGIGTDSPSHRLDLVESANAYAARITNNSDGSQGLQIRTSDNDGDLFILDLQSSTSATGTDYTSRFVVEKSGNVGIGSNDPHAILDVKTSTDGRVLFIDSSGDPDIVAVNNANSAYANLKLEGATITGRISGNERFKIDTNGNTLVRESDLGGTPSSAVALQVGNNTNNDMIHTRNKTSSGSVFHMFMKFDNIAPDDTTSYFLQGADSSTQRFFIYSNGNIVNHDNSYGAISDIKLKEQIKDASSQWDDVKALRIRKYKMKEQIANKGDSDNLWKLGVVAQEVEASGMSGLVNTNKDFDQETKEDLGTTTKTVKYSILYMKAVKALQEAMTRIETLEAKVAKLEGE